LRDCIWKLAIYRVHSRTEEIMRVCAWNMPHPSDYTEKTQISCIATHFSHEIKGQRMSTEKTIYLFYIANLDLCALHTVLGNLRGPEQCSWCSEWGPRWGGARFSAPVQTDPGAYSASYTMGTGSFPRVKRSECGVYHILPSSA